MPRRCRGSDAPALSVLGRSGAEGADARRFTLAALTCRIVAGLFLARLTLQPQHISPHRPDTYWGRPTCLLILFHVVIWTVIPLLTYPNVSLDVAEITAWGHEWQLGYFKHPPLASWIQEIGRVVSGRQAIWGVYLVGELVVAGTFYAVWKLARRFVDAGLLMPAGAFVAVLTLEASFVYTIISLEFNHSFLVLLFSALAVWFFYEALTCGTRGAMTWWVALGVAMGAGMLSKYIMAFPILAMSLFALVDSKARQWMKRPHPYVAVVVSLLVFSPNLVWLYRYNFAPLAYVEDRSSSTVTGAMGHLTNPLKFLIDQILFLIPMVLVMLAWSGLRWRVQPADTDEQCWARRFLLAMVAGPFLLFLSLSIFTGIALRAAWGVPLWPFAPLLMLVFLQPPDAPANVRGTLRLSIILIGVNILAGLGIPVVMPFVMQNRSETAQKSLRVIFPGRMLAEHVDQVWREHEPGQPLRIIAGERWMANNVNFYSPDRPSVLTEQATALGYAKIDEEACPWTSLAKFRKYGGILLWDADYQGPEIPPSLSKHVPEAVTIGTFRLNWMTDAKLKPLHIGIALLRPGDRNEPVSKPQIPMKFQSPKGPSLTNRQGYLPEVQPSIGNCELDFHWDLGLGPLVIVLLQSPATTRSAAVASGPVAR